MGEHDDAAGRSANSLPARVLDGLLEGLQVVDPEFRYVYVNQAVTQQARKSRAELLGRTMLDAYPGIEQTEMFGVLQRCMHERRATAMENEFAFEDGSHGWFELRFEPIAEGVAILSLDITERKQAERTLARTARTLATLSQCNQALVRASDGQDLMQDICRLLVESGGHRAAWIALLDSADGDGLRRMATYCRPGSRDSLAVVGSPTYESLWPRIIERSRLAILREEDNASARETPIILLPILVGAGCVGILTIVASERDAFDAEEQKLLREVALDLGYGIDTLITRLNQGTMTHQLEQARARTRAIYDHLPDATFVWKRTPESFLLVDRNHAADALTRADMAERVGLPPSELPIAVPHLETDLEACFSNRQTVRRQAKCLPDGANEPKHMVLSYGFIPPDMVLLHAQDISELRRAEQQLIAAQRLEAVGQLAGGIAHDFNNLLSIILMYTEFAIQQMSESDPVRADMQQVEQSGTRAAALTRQLLTFSRREIVEPETMSLNDVIHGIVPMARRLLGQGIHVDVDTADDLSPIRAAPAHIEQVVMNLAVNARDAMPQGGTLSITTSNVIESRAATEADTGSTRHLVRLRIADTGTGMTPDVQARLFEPFFTTKPEGKGTGLGLATVYGIVKQNRGEIRLDSSVGRGTTFEIDLPAVEGATGRPETTSTQVPRGNETVLVVDDEEAVRLASARILREAGYRVYVAANAGEALLIGEQHGEEIDLLLTDVIMPRVSGAALAARLRALIPSLKVLFVSGFPGTESDAEAHSLDEFAFIAKPLSKTTLTHHVRRVLDERR